MKSVRREWENSCRVSEFAVAEQPARLECFTQAEACWEAVFPVLLTWDPDMAELPPEV